jgi:hypothetical protein
MRYQEAVLSYFCIQIYTFLITRENSRNTNLNDLPGLIPKVAFRLVVFIVFFVEIQATHAQDTSEVKDSLGLVFADSLRSIESDLETTVKYTATDSIINEVDSETVHMYRNAEVIYGDISLKADYIRLDWGKSEVYAYGLPDSTGEGGVKVRGKPVFIQGGDSYDTDTIRYNFKSRKALINNIVTKEGEGIIQGEKVKKDPKDNLYLVDAKYTTCDLAEPHFHIGSRKIKLVDKKSVISGPFNFVLAGIPLPVGLPFGFFPVPKKKEIGTSGFVMGSYGEEPNSRGFYFRDFGYYHAFNEYIGAKVLGQIYSRGSWGAAVQSQYTKRYRYNGNLNLQFNFNKPGDEESLSGASRDFSLSWTHSPQNGRKDRSFSSSVNLVSNRFNQNNRRLDAVDQYTNNTFGSGVQYRRDIGKLLRTNTSFNINQNVSTQVLNGTLGYTIGLNQFNPFVKEKNRVGRWHESFRMGLDITGGYRFTNIISNRSTSYIDYNLAGVSNEPITQQQQRRIQELQNLLMSAGLTEEQRAQYQAELKSLTNPTAQGLMDILNNGVFNTSYSVPISLPNLKVFKHINITPGVSYRGDFFTSELKYDFANPGINETQTFTKASGKTVTVVQDTTLSEIVTEYDELGNMKVLLNSNSGGVVIMDTLNRPAFGQQYGFNASMNTRFYGTYRFKPGRKFSAIRHTVAPSVSLSYTPDTDGQYAYKTVVRENENGEQTVKYLSRFLNSSGSNQSAAGNLGFSLVNNLEAKIRSKSDSSETEYEKVSLIDNFSISSSYNLFAKTELGEYALAPINFNANTTLFKKLVNVNAGGTIDPYAYETDELIASNKAGVRMGRYKWDRSLSGEYVGNYLSNFRVAVSTRLSPKTFKKETPRKNEPEDPAREAMERFVAANPMAYVDFSIPWSINFNYTFNYSKQGQAAAIVTQALQITGDLSLTPKWKVTYSTGWDFVFNAVTLTNIGMMRELHCWDMSFNWTPISGNSMRASNYSFDLRVRSSLLSDLKLSRRRQYFDRGGF